MSEVDVVVVGSGAAGLTAALAAQEQGAQVMVAESEAVVGGASRLSAGMMMAAGTDVQRAANLDDDPAGLYDEYQLLNQYETKPGLARRLAFDGGPTVGWLQELGVSFRPDVMQGGGERVPRTHIPVGGGQQLIDTLAQRCRDRGIEIALGNRVTGLISRDGVVAGVTAGGDDLAASAVVLATGGFGANRALIAEHLPSVARYGDSIVYIGPDSSRGDGLALATEVGAQTVGHDRCVQLLSPPIGTREFTAYLPVWLLLLGPDGRRVCNETSPYGVLDGLLQAAGEVAYGLFDSRTLAENGTPALPTMKMEYPPGTPLAGGIWTTESLQRMIDAGGIVRAPTLEGLATTLGLPVDAVLGAVARYNEFAAAGLDRDFDKYARYVRAVEQPPFYGAPIRPSVLGVTTFGIEIDDMGQVMNAQSAAISGLFAAGECTGGVIGPRYMGSGNSIANAVVFGRTAGIAAAKHALG